jgi:peptidoglycan hydrolase-like protein with peptidoglycan-binding domain
VDPPKAIDVAAAIPAPPPPAPPVTVPDAAAPIAAQAEVALTWAEVVEIQKRLASLGIDPGPIDGVAGPRTTASARKYEERVGHAVTGKVDHSLLVLLRQDQDTSATLQARAP